jgi:hypothetical protein
MQLPCPLLPSGCLISPISQRRAIFKQSVLDAHSSNRTSIAVSALDQCNILLTANRTSYFTRLRPLALDAALEVVPRDSPFAKDGIYMHKRYGRPRHTPTSCPVLPNL